MVGRPFWSYIRRSAIISQEASRVSDPVQDESGVSNWTQIRFSNFSGSGPESGYGFSARIWNLCSKFAENTLNKKLSIRERIEIITEDREKMKKATVVIENHENFHDEGGLYLGSGSGLSWEVQTGSGEYHTGNETLKARKFS